MFILKVKVQLPDGTIDKLPLAVQFKGMDKPEIAKFKSFDEAIEWCTYCLPGSPDIEEIKDE